MREVLDINNQKFIIDEEDRDLVDYDNEREEIIWEAKVIEGELKGEYIRYKERGVVEDLEERMRRLDNYLLVTYKILVKLNEDKNDPRGEIWKKFVEKVRKQEGKFFEENKNFKREYLITPTNP